MKLRLLLPVLVFAIYSCANSQETKPRLVGGPCEGCEAVFEYGDRKLTDVDTLPEFADAENKLKVTGTIYKPDGKTPAEDVILYIHHTDAGGVYPTRRDEKGWAKRHGYLRGWIKTGSDGSFTFYTQMPGTYPSRSEPAHIHPYILEPDGKYYWLGSYFFEGDPLLQPKHGDEALRGGESGIVKPVMKDGILTVERNFVLGKNVEGYNPRRGS